MPNVQAIKPKSGSKMGSSKRRRNGECENGVSDADKPDSYNNLRGINVLREGRINKVRLQSFIFFFKNQWKIFKKRNRQAGFFLLDHF